MQFQSTLPRGERPRALRSGIRTMSISIHAPARGATGELAGTRCWGCDFNPRSREGSDRALCRLLTGSPNFNPRSREGSDQSCSEKSQIWKNFNPRSREGSDRPFPRPTPVLPISIHAPARGATQAAQILDLSIIISIHAPARGATYVLMFFPSRDQFQSTLPRGERHGSRQSISQALHRISIHAPARGATALLPDPAYLNQISIHAPARGATYRKSGGYVFADISIHAPARGATGEYANTLADVKFQSTLPRGERHELEIFSDDYNIISIHAPARGATSIHTCLLLLVDNFNPRSREGSDRLGM